MVINFDTLIPQNERYPLIDIGCNLAHKQFAGDWAEVINNAKKVGVCQVVITGTSERDSRKAMQLAHERPGVLFFTAGVHPHDAKTCGPSTINNLAQLASDPQCVAIGECGLDFDRNFSAPAVQEKVGDS